MDDNSSNIDQQLLISYLNTSYHLLNTSIYIKIGQLNGDLDSFLIDNNAYSWAFISPQNPQSQVISREENDQLYQTFLQEVQNNHIRYWPGQGIGTDPNWIPEDSLLLLDVSKEDALKIAKRYDQKTLVYGMINLEAELVMASKC